MHICVNLGVVIMQRQHIKSTCIAMSHASDVWKCVFVSVHVPRSLSALFACLVSLRETFAVSILQTAASAKYHCQV